MYMGGGFNYGGGGGWNGIIQYIVIVYINLELKIIINNVFFFQDLVFMDIQIQFGNSKEYVRIVYNSVCKLKDIVERMVTRVINYVCDMFQFGQELR